VSLITPAATRGPNSVIRIKRPSERRSLSRSATRALDVLEFFGEAQRPLRAVDIARMLAMNPSTTNQLLKTMVDSGHLVFEARGKTYLPSPRLAGFSSGIVATYGAGGRLRDLIREVHARTGGASTVTVTTPNDLFMQVIDLATPDDRPTERGLRISLFGSAIGSAYLAMLGDAEIARLADRARIPAAEVPAILEGAAHIRRVGHADGPSTDRTIWSIAMALPMQGLRVPTVLGLAGPPEQVREGSAEIAAIMREGIARWLEERPD
jgi:DNA-binding IclR family transcriptional regulator